MVGTDAIDVVIPVFQRAERVREAVASALAQTRAPNRIIVVDDGSTDDTPAVVDHLAATHDNVTALHRPNGGPSAARNTGIAASEATWICFCDSDDVLPADSIEVRRNWLDANPSHDGVVGRSESQIAPHVQLPPHVKAQVEGERDAPLVQSLLVRRERLDAVDGYDERLRLGEDLDLFVRLREAGARIGEIPETVYVRRVFGDNISLTGTDPSSTLLHLARRAAGRRRTGD